MEASEEYQKLYSLLASLASKGGSNTNDGTNPTFSLMDILVGEKKGAKSPLSRNPESGRSASAPRLRMAEPKEQPKVIPKERPKEQPNVSSKEEPKVQPKVQPKEATLPMIRETRTVTELLEHLRSIRKRVVVIEEPEKPEPIIKCNACEKVFISTITQKNHLKHSIACQKWLERPRPLFSVPPLHELVDEWLHQAISLPDQIICQFCTTSFCNKGNLHKHYQTATVCNRLGYLRFLEIIRSK